MTVDILALGEAMVEFNQTGDGNGRSYLQGFGGDTSNAAIAAARQGARVGYISSLGDDVYGRMLRTLWNAEGVDHSTVLTDAQAFTAVYFVTHDEGGHHFSFFRRGSAASRMTPAQLPQAAITQAKVLHVSGISAAISESACDTCFAAIDMAKQAGVKVSFDTNLRLKLWTLPRARAVMRDLIRLSDICLPSYDDVVAISGLKKPDELVDYCLGLGASIVALKLGAEGALIDDGKHRIRLAAHPCTPVDATGAGDTFGGALLARLIAGDGFEQAGRYAVVASALSTQGYGAVEPIPLEMAIREEMARHG
ncbi:sugar kinase [Cupriavidus sp. 2KB_3]|uniref:sugar kinase n=1 Tax=Cupriavidus sp. 2KB_3 TaxID=3232980 RepID=UPI003F8EC123